MSCDSKTIKMALVLDTSSDESGIKVIDVTRVEHVTQNYYLIETKNVESIPDAGENLRPFDVLNIIQGFLTKYKISLDDIYIHQGHVIQ